MLLIVNALSKYWPSESVARIVNEYCVGDVDEPPKSVVVIFAPLKVIFPVVRFDPTSEYVIVLSDEADKVTSVPEKLPANEPNACAVLQVGAVEALQIAEPLIPAFPSGLVILTL